MLFFVLDILEVKRAQDQSLMTRLCRTDQVPKYSLKPKLPFLTKSEESIEIQVTQPVVSTKELKIQD